MYTDMCKIIITLETRNKELEELLDRCTTAMQLADAHMKLMDEAGNHWMNAAIELEEEVELLRNKLKNCTSHN